MRRDLVRQQTDVFRGLGTGYGSEGKGRGAQLDSSGDCSRRLLVSRFQALSDWAVRSQAAL